MTIAKSFSGLIRVVNVYEKGKLKQAETTIAAAEQDLKKERILHETVLVLGSNPGKVLVSLAKKENFDLIVVGNRGLGGSASIFLGSVSKQVVSNAYGNVLVVKK
jgi:nucleotide-binding universal stress UspA family protein